MASFFLFLFYSLWSMSLSLFAPLSSLSLCLPPSRSEEVTVQKGG